MSSGVETSLNVPTNSKRFLDFARNDRANCKMMQVFAPAKINLSLRILGRRNDGFHEIETLIAPISLCDQIEIDKADCEKGIEFSCDDLSLPTGDENLIVRGAKSFFAATKITPAISIENSARCGLGWGEQRRGFHSAGAQRPIRSEIAARNAGGNSGINRIGHSIFYFSVYRTL